MGKFQIPETVAIITFDGTRYEGGEVTLRIELPMRVVSEFQGLAAAFLEEGIASAEQTQRRAAMTKMFVDMVLVDWNLLDKTGKDLPATNEGFDELSFRFIGLILAGWAEAMNVDDQADTPNPLPLGSENGHQGVEIELQDTAVTGG